MRDISEVSSVPISINSCVSKTVNAEWCKTDLTFITNERMGTEFFEFWLVNTCPLCCGSNLGL